MPVGFGFFTIMECERRSDMSVGCASCIMKFCFRFIRSRMDAEETADSADRRFPPALLSDGSHTTSNKPWRMMKNS